MKIIHCDPSALRPKPKSKPKPKPKPKVKTKTAEYSLSEAGSFERSGEWLDIDDFPMPDFDALRSFDPAVHARFGATDPSGSLDQRTTPQLNDTRQ